MTSASVGIATFRDSGDFYDEDVREAVRITTSGTYVHAAPWNAALMGVRNTRARSRTERAPALSALPH